jgi:hypothetical protein
VRFEAPPFVFLLSVPPNTANTMAIATGTADADFFEGHRNRMQNALAIRRDLIIDGLPVSLEAFTDRNSGETSCAEIRGRNYSVNVAIGARRYRIASEHSGMVLDVADDGLHIVQQPSDASSGGQEWMLLDRSGAGYEIIHRRTKKSLTVSRSADGNARLTLEPRRAGPSGELLGQDGASGRYLEWAAQAFIIRNTYGDPTPIISMGELLVLDVEDRSREPGAPVIPWPPHLGPNQMFRLHEII